MTTDNLTTRPKVAVIVLNWNGEDLLRRYLPSVVEHTPRHEADVIVADNGSGDGSPEMLQREFPTVRVIRFDENYGFAEGYNRAIAEAGYEYTVLLNSDAEVTRGWLTPLLDCMEADPTIGACQPKIRSVRRPEEFEYAGAAGGFLDRHGYPYCRGRIFDTVETDRGQYDSLEPTDVMWASGAALMVRTAVYQEVGGLDPAFFAHMEEIDLCWRMWLAGYRVVAVTGSVVRHYGGASLSASDPRKTYLNFRNNLLMMHKNLPARVRGRRLFVRRLLDTAALLKFIASGDFGDAKAVWRAHRDFRTMRRSMPTAPEGVPDLLRQAPDTGISILAAYYLRGRKRFADI